MSSMMGDVNTSIASVEVMDAGTRSIVSDIQTNNPTATSMVPATELSPVSIIVLSELYYIFTKVQRQDIYM